MKLRVIVAGSLVSIFIFVSGVMAAAQNFQPVYTPHAVGVTPSPVGITNSTVSRESLPSGASWAKIVTAPSVSVGAMLLLTDGRVLVHSEPNCAGCKGDYTTWYTLTPDITGSYINGTWTKVATLPNGYAPLFFGSAVLAGAALLTLTVVRAPRPATLPEIPALAPGR